MEKTSRQKVFEIIRKHNSITVSELNQFFDMTPANIRHHLGVLAADGLVERIDTRKKPGKGRPEAVFAVNRVFHEDGLVNLVENILDVWALTFSPGDLELSMKAIALKLAGEIKDHRLIPVNKRLTECMLHLNDLQYRAQWEASPSGPRIKLGNCPYRKILDRHPEICSLDKYLLEEKIGINFSQVSKLELDERGLSYCIFVGR